MKTSVILELAADIMARNGRARRGWVTRIPGRAAYDCPVDPWGAINIACGYAPDCPDVRSVAPARALALYVGLEDTGCRLWPAKELGDWADHPDRTDDHLIGALRSAAHAARKDNQ